MSEGGIFAWKVQKLRVAPSLSFNSKPLQAPPGKEWKKDLDTNEWRLLDKQVDDDASLELITDSLHYVQDSDTFQGICLKYKVTPLELRRANGGFTGENLRLAPNPLTIPKTATTTTTTTNTPKDLTHDQAVMFFCTKFRNMSSKEARAYLMMSDWNVGEAIEMAKEDEEFSPP